MKRHFTNTIRKVGYKGDLPKPGDIEAWDKIRTEVLDYIAAKTTETKPEEPQEGEQPGLPNLPPPLPKKRTGYEEF